MFLIACLSCLQEDHNNRIQASNILSKKQVVSPEKTRKCHLVLTMNPIDLLFKNPPSARFSLTYLSLFLPKRKLGHANISKLGAAMSSCSLLHYHSAMHVHYWHLSSPCQPVTKAHLAFSQAQAIHFLIQPSNPRKPHSSLEDEVACCGLGWPPKWGVGKGCKGHA